MLDLMNRVYCTVWTRLRREEGQTMVEYGLIVALVAAAAVLAVAAAGGKVSDIFTWISDNLKTS